MYMIVFQVQTVVKRWSNGGQTAVKGRSNGGRTEVKRWSNGGQRAVKRRMIAVFMIVFQAPIGVREGPLGRVWPPLTAFGMLFLATVWLHILYSVGRMAQTQNGAKNKN